MKESMWGYSLVLLGIAVSTFMIMISNMTTTNQQDYYLLKEITNAAMIDSIDYSYYREYKEIKINTEKFVEVFIRRFSEAVSLTNTYRIDFYSIYENPPSVSIKVTSNTGDFQIWGDSTNIDVINSYDAILESNNVITTSEIFYSMPYGSCGDENYISTEEKLEGKNEPNPDYHYCQMAVRAKFNISENSTIYKNIKEKVGPSKAIDKTKIKILNVEYITNLSSQDDIINYEKWYSATYDRLPSLADVPKGMSKAENFAKNIKDVNVTLKQEKTATENNYYLAYGLKYNCEDATSFDYYRKGTTFDDMEYKHESELTDTTGYEKAPFYGNCLVGIKYRVNFYYDENAK